MEETKNLNSDQNKSGSKIETQKIDRVILEKGSLEILSSMLNQIRDSVGDLVAVSQKDLVNFLIQKRKASLSQQEIKMISEDNYDLIRALKRATSEAIRARQLGNEIKIDEVLKIIQTPSVSGDRPSSNDFKLSKNFNAEGGSCDLLSGAKGKKRKSKRALNDLPEVAVSESKSHQNHELLAPEIS
jgi:hypothetical protein